MKQTECQIKLGCKETRFNQLVTKEAKELLVEITRIKKTYGEIKRELEICKKTLMWTNKNSHYLVVIKRAELLLKREIDAIIRD